MATRPDLGLKARRRVTTYSKHFKRRAQPEDKLKRGGRMTTAPVESSVWDFHEDEDEIASPDVTIGKFKPRPNPQPRMRTMHDITPQNSANSYSTRGRAPSILSNPKKRRASVGARNVARTVRAFSTPPSPPSSTEERMPPPPHAIPLPRPIKAVKSLRMTVPLDASKKSHPTMTSGLRISSSNTSLPAFTFSAERSVTDCTTYDKTKKQFLQTKIPFRPIESPRSSTSSLRQENASSSKLGSCMSLSLNQTAPRKKRRLIDELAAQVDECSSEDEVIAAASQHARRTQTPEPHGMWSVGSPHAVPSTPEPSRPRTYGRQDSAKKRTGPKFTYSSHRTIRAENTLTGGLDTLDETSWLKESLLPNEGSRFDIDEDIDQSFTTGAVRSIHELRQAGANSRSADEIEDLLSRVGPSCKNSASNRRNALIELSQKMQDKSFVRKFRDHNGDRSLFDQVGTEMDIIAGYALVAILTTLVASTASTHIVSQLHGQGFCLLIERLLKIPIDIQTLARDRASNLSRSCQQSMMKLKASLLILPIWEPTTPFKLSPRRLALKALDLVVKNSGIIGNDFLSTEVTDQLFSLLSNASMPDSWAWPHQDESIDFHLALTLLESYSMQAMRGEAKERWTFTHLPVLADTLAKTLRRCNGHLSEIGTLLMKLALNISNNNHDAPAAFIEKDTIRILSGALCDTFKAATNSIYDADAFNSHFESLLLMLGVMINFSENDRATGKSLLDAKGSNAQAPLDRLIKVFLEHHVSTSEADSFETSQLNVAFGYLSVLLGYMSLFDGVRQRFGSMHKAGNLTPLMEAIREFMIYNRAAANAMSQDGAEQPSASYSNFTSKLQGLVERLGG